ncbi:MAG: amino acid adenylation protein, partial [bacterium]
SEAKLIAEQSVTAPISRVCPDNLAYAIYTSGSTGLPKGTLLAHRGLCSLISTQIAHFQINSNSRLLQTLSISGDASLWEIFAALLSGAALYLADKEQTLPGQELIDLLNKNQITVLCPAIRALSAVPEGEIPSLETILAGGETCPPELVARWAKNHNLYNCYGPTEATVCTTYFKCDVNMSRTPPIGKPFANAKVYILDKYLQAVPIGVVGEMYISGIALARGYLNRAELTAEKFIPDPFSQTPSQRMYRTGDLAKYLVDGNIQFLGRADHQIKIRGFRIELDEIEEIIFTHPDVTEAVVIAEEVTPGDKQILAYAVANTLVKESSLVDELRSLLKLKLPPFMIPSEIIVLDVFPRLLSGKVDRRSLPIPTSFSHEVSSLPITGTEKAIASIWKDLLKKEAIDRNDDFFDLGGHSMLMVELASQLKSVLKVNVGLRSLFESSSLTKMASAIDEVLAKNSNKSDVDDATKGVNVDKRFFEEAAKSLTKIEHREILPLFISGEIAKVDAVAIDYLPITFLSDTSLSREQLFSTWFNNKPIISEIREGSLGRLATIMLPRFDLELHANKDSLIKLLVEGLEIAKQIGAKVVSLTGLIPSATNYGQALVDEIKDRELPAITTGHAVTTASVIMSIEKILKESGRDIRKERVIFLGLGSIGLTTLRLMLKCLPSPESITLCDIYSKVAMLKELKAQMKEQWGFENEVNIVESSKILPQEIYNGSLIIGATNVENLIEVSKLKAGTMIVDDSAPHCFDTNLALKRFNQQSDILFTEGGTLESPKAMTRTIYLPSQASELIDISLLRAMIRMNPSEIPSSNFSS